MDSTDNSRQTRINNAKTFLKEYSDEKVACAPTIFNLAHLKLNNSIAKDNKPVFIVINSGQNKILESYQVDAVHEFIYSLLAHGIQLSKKVVFNAIVTLKCTQNPDCNAPTMQWFRG